MPTPLRAERRDDHDQLMTRLSAAGPDAHTQAQAYLRAAGPDLLAAILAGPGQATTATDRSADRSTGEAELAPRAGALGVRRAGRDHDAVLAAFSHRSRRPRKASTRALALALAAVALTATGVAVGTDALRPAGAPPAASSSPAGTISVVTDTRPAATAPAGAVLVQLASASLSQGAGTSTGGGQARAGQVNYLAQTSAVRLAGPSGDFTRLGRQSSQLWEGPQGGGCEVLTSDAAELTSGTYDWQAGQGPDGGTRAASRLGALVVTELSTDPTVLAAQIAKHAATMPLPVGNDGMGSVEDTELDLLAGLLAEPTVSPAQRAAAFTALSQRGEVGLLGQHSDPLGRTGTAVEYDVHNGATWRVTLTFDPDNAVLLANESTLTERGDQQWLAAVPLGAWDWTVTTASGLVAAIGDTDGLQPAPELTVG